MEPILLVLLLCVSLCVAFAIGCNDETMSPAVGSRVLSLNSAVVLGAIINLIGALTIGERISHKIGSELVSGRPLTLGMIFAILIAVSLWLIVASFFRGLPISTTQCMVGSVIGVALSAQLLGEIGWEDGTISWTVVGQIVAGWVISPIIGLLASGLLLTAIRRFQQRTTGLFAREKQERTASYILPVFLIWTSLSRGGNDVSNAVAPLVAFSAFQGNIMIGGLILPSTIIPLAIGGLGMGIGLTLVGRRVIKTLATEVVTLTPTSALSASISVSIVLFSGAMLGIPLSGTHVLVASLIAVGWVERTGIRTRQARDIFASWLITVPLSALIAAAIYIFIGRPLLA